MLTVALYDKTKAVKREREIRTLLRRTLLTFTDGGHITTHFSPLYPVEELARSHAGHPCHEPIRRMIVNHRGEMLMCCDDLIGNFDLGNVKDHTIEELWFSEKHQDLVLALEKPGGRTHPYCKSCPRG